MISTKLQQKKPRPSEKKHKKTNKRRRDVRRSRRRGHTRQWLIEFHFVKLPDQWLSTALLFSTVHSMQIEKHSFSSKIRTQTIKKTFQQRNKSFNLSICKVSFRDECRTQRTNGHFSMEMDSVLFEKDDRNGSIATATLISTSLIRRTVFLHGNFGYRNE